MIKPEEDSWRVLELSGYLDTLPASHIEYVRERYLGFWASDCKDRLCDITYGPTGPCGLAAAVETTSGRWLLHHLAKVPGVEAPRAHILILRMVRELLAEHSDAQKFDIYFEEDKPLNSRLFLDFINSNSEGQNSLGGYSFYRVPPPPNLRLRPPFRLDQVGGHLDVTFGPEGGNVFGLMNTAKVFDLRSFEIAQRFFYLMNVGMWTALIPANQDGASAVFQLDPTRATFLSRGFHWSFDRATMRLWISYLEAL